MYFISYELEDVIEIYLTMNLLGRVFNSDFIIHDYPPRMYCLWIKRPFLFEKKLKMFEITGTLGHISALDKVEKLNLTRIRIWTLCLIKSLRLDSLLTTSCAMIMFMLYITEMIKYIDAFIINKWNHCCSISSQIYKLSVESWTNRENLWAILFQNGLLLTESQTLSITKHIYFNFNKYESMENIGVPNMSATKWPKWDRYEWDAWNRV